MWQRIRSAPGARHAGAVLATAGIVATFVPTGGPRKSNRSAPCATNNRSREPAMTTMLRRLRYLLRQRQIDAEMAEELETHRLLAERRLIAGGASAADAAAASRRAMGNVALAREDARAAWIAPWLDGAWQDVAYAARMFRQAPAFSGAMVMVMGLGIGAATGVFALVDALILRSLPVPAADRLVYFSAPSFSYPIFSEVRARSADVFSSVAAWSVESLHVAWSAQLEPADVLTVSGNFYSTLGIQPARGRLFNDDDDQIGGGREGLVAVVSYSAWQRRFTADPAVLGRRVRIGPLPYTIVGITPPGFFGVTPGLAPEITIPLTSNQRPDRLKSGSSSWVHLLGRMRDGVTLAGANVALHRYWPQVLETTTSPAMPADRRAIFLGRRTSIESAHAGYSRVRNRFAEPLWLLSGLVGLLLLVACASAANLLLARGIGRRREIAVRLAIGAGRGRIVRQMLTESLLWTAAATAVGLLLAAWGAATLTALMTTRQQPIELSTGINPRVLMFSVVLALITSAVCSLVPALRATRIDAAASLKETGQISASLSGRWMFGRSLVASQVAVTVLLVAGAALFVRSLYGVLSQDAGFDRNSVLVLSTDVEAAGFEDDRAAAFYRSLLGRLKETPGVASVSLSMYPPISDGDGAWTQTIGVDGAVAPTAAGAATVYFNTVSPGFFRTTGMRLVRGRDVSDADNQSAPRVAIVNETLARRFFQGQDPLGRQISLGRDRNRQNLLIVGIAGDAKYQRLQEQPRAIAYLPWEQQRGGNMFVELRLDRPGEMADAIGSEVRRLDGSVPLHIESVADRIRESLVTERVLATLASALGVAAVALACAGLYGLLAYAVSRQAREIGLRLALGAHRHRVLVNVLLQSVFTATAGIIAGIGAALALGRFARGLLFQVAPTDPVSIATAAAVMFVVACLAAVGPAWRAARVDPVVALRVE